MTQGTAPHRAASVTDHRPVPPGVLPKRAQTWLMVGIAGVMLAIILLAGRTTPPARPATSTPAPPPSTDRVREYQERLRALDAQAAQELQARGLAPSTTRTGLDDEPPAAKPEDPLVAARKKRAYESLFASNVVLSRRPPSQRPDSGVMPDTNSSMAASRDGAMPSIDDIADAALRATSRANTTESSRSGNVPPPPTEPNDAAEATTAGGQPAYRILEGSVIDTVLTNRIDGAVASPVNCLVTHPVYSSDGEHVLIPAGARVLGNTKPVQSVGDVRLAVMFHRLVMPDGRTRALDQYPGGNQLGDIGLRDRVDQHYRSTFGAAAAIGLISGLAQPIGTATLGGVDSNRTVVVAGSATDATSQATAQTMNRFLNRLPTITIREGHRVTVYLTSDLQLPVYDASAVPTRF